MNKILVHILVKELRWILSTKEIKYYCLKNDMLIRYYSCTSKHAHISFLFPRKSLSWHHDPIFSIIELLGVEITNAYDYSWSDLKITHHGQLNNSATLGLVVFKTIIPMFVFYKFIFTVCMSLYNSQKHNMTNDHCYM